jgi:hypothetical protein
VLRSDPKRPVLFAAFVGCVVAANWALNRYGIVPIGFGLTAPAGVYFAGLGFGLRDALHEAGGRTWVLAAIGTGAVVSWFIGGDATIPGGHVSIAVASGLAFAFSEFADLAVYEPLREKAWPAAVACSNVVGAAVDSALFLWLAFGSLDHMAGQVVAKTYMIVLALPVVWWARHNRQPVSA